MKCLCWPLFLLLSTPMCVCVCVWKVKVCMCKSWSPYLELLALSLWAAVFPSSSRFSIVNEEDRRERGLLVLIYPGGSLGITINSQLLAHSTGPHRHCQFVPIREPSFWVSAVRGCSGPTGEQPARAWLRPDHSGLGCIGLVWWNTCWLWSPAWFHEPCTVEYAIKLLFLWEKKKQRVLCFALKCVGLKMLFRETKKEDYFRLSVHIPLPVSSFLYIPILFTKG